LEAFQQTNNTIEAYKLIGKLSTCEHISTEPTFDIEGIVLKYFNRRMHSHIYIHTGFVLDLIQQYILSLRLSLQLSLFQQPSMLSCVSYVNILPLAALKKTRTIY